MTTTEPTPDQSYCDLGMHQQCSGYTEDESDPETCMCPCHDPNPDPRQSEPLTCITCGVEVVETDGVLLHIDETYDHLARTARKEH